MIRLLAMERIVLPNTTLSLEDRQFLLGLAKAVITHGVSSGSRYPLQTHDLPATLREHRAAFVSVYVSGILRGCTGELEARRSLAECVAHHAHSAAFLDDRFPRIEERDLPDLGVQISVLGIPTPISFKSEADLIENLRPNVDGLIIEGNGKQATFLPQVWESLPKADDFLDQLKRKAGLPLAPVPGLQAWRYGAEVFGRESAS
jgi:AmmeMemoRadiSam system protein A